MSPSRLPGAALRVVTFAVLFLAILIAASALVEAGLAYVRGGTPFDVGNLTIGLVCSLIAGVFIAAFHLRKETHSVPVKNAEQFLGEAEAALAELGYEVVHRTPTSLATRPGFQSFLLGHGVAVEVEGAEAKITGPKLCVELLRKRVRLHAQVTHLHESRLHRRPELPIKRFELHLRLHPEQLEKVRRQVVATLEAEADVTCELRLTAQNDRGMTAAVVESQLRPWLEEHGIGVVVHKEYLRTAETEKTQVVQAWA